jgi:integrase
MRRNLSDRLVRTLARAGGPIEIWDQQLPGFGCRIQQGGGVVFFAMRRQRGAGRPQAVRLTIGPYPMWKLAEARERARRLLRDLYDGVDPRQREAEQQQATADVRASTVAAVAEEFITKHVRKTRTARGAELRIRRELVARWGTLPITMITRANVVMMIDEIAARGHQESARSTLKLTKHLFRWAVGRGHLTASPASDIRARDLLTAAKSRQRVLSDSELALVWRAAGEGTEGTLVRLLLLLGQRLRETAHASWGELDLDHGLWVIGAERMKEELGHSVPLPAVAVELLRALPRIGSCTSVFTVTGGRPLTDPARTKKRLDARVAELNGGVPLEPWVFHDLRRSFRTGLSTLGVKPHIAELCIAHKQKGVAGIYDRHRYDLEKRRAFERWARHLRQILEPAGAGATVTPLAPRRHSRS